MSEERGFSHAWQIAAAAVIAFAIECIAVRGFLLGMQPWAFLGEHFALVAALCLWSRYSPGLRADVRLPLLLIAGTAALGPVGPAGTLVAMALTRWYMRGAVPFDEWYRALFPETAEEPGDAFAKQVANSAQDDPAGLAPFSEILAFGSVQQKQALIALINRSFRPAFGQILKRALTDSNNAIRVQAATAMNRIERDMHERTIRLGRLANERPDDPDALLELARHYDQYLYSGILDARREEQVRELALDAYRRYNAIRPDNGDSRMAISRLLLRGGRYSEAAVSLEASQHDGFSTQYAELWYVESLFNLGRFAELRKYARQLQDRLDGADGLPPAAVEAVRTWAAAEGEMAAAGVLGRE
jgi:tetratricopeptide (TPR) repeat protein